MKIRRFQAADMATALRAVRATLGPDAVLLGSRQTEGQAGAVEVTAAVDWDRAAAPPEVQGQEIVGLVAAVRALVETQRVRDLPPAARGFFWRLRAAGVDDEVAARVAEDAARRCATGEPAEGALRSAIGAAVPPRPAPEGSAVLVGPTGAGKTVTVAKLAAALRREGRRVAVVSADSFRVGAREELATYARLLDVPFGAAADAVEFGRLARRWGEGCTVLVDTPGLGPSQPERLADVAQLLAEMPGERMWVLPATISAEAAAQAWEAVAPFAPSSCTITKVDEVRGGAGLYGLLARERIGAAFLGSGPNVPADLVRATAGGVAAWVLGAG